MNHSSHYGNGAGGHRGGGGGGGGGGSNDGSKHYHSNPHVSLGSSQVLISYNFSFILLKSGRFSSPSYLYKAARAERLDH